MVCVPCFIIPVFLYIWHKFLQPILLRYWNPWEKKDAQGNVIKTIPENPFECVGGVCAWKGSKKVTNETDQKAVQDGNEPPREGEVLTTSDHNDKKFD